MHGSTIPRQNQYVKTLLQQEGPIAKGKVCDGLPNEMVHTMVENQIEYDQYNVTSCEGVKTLCQNPSCEKHCWNAPPKTKQVIDTCKEVMKTNRCLSVLDEYLLVRKSYKSVITDDPYEDELSYFHRLLKAKFKSSPFGIYKIMIGDYKDQELEGEIQETRDKLKSAVDPTVKGFLKNDLFYSLKEKNTNYLPKAARPYELTENEKTMLEKMFREQHVVEQDTGQWAKYTIKSCLEFLFGSYPGVFDDLCMLFIDDELDEDGDPIFTEEELRVKPGYPDGPDFYKGNIMYDINEGLDAFFSVSSKTWNEMLYAFDNANVSQLDKQRLKQKFLVMLGFLDALYLDYLYETEMNSW